MKDEAKMKSGGSGRITTAMVLAAGLGTRMRPLSERTPKPLLMLAGRTLLDHALDRLADAGIERAVVNVHYCADQIEARLKGRTAPEIIISDEREAILETGGGVRKALPYVGQNAFIVHNSDSVWSEGEHPNVSLLMNAWEPRRMGVLLLLARCDSSIGYFGHGDFHMDGKGSLERRVPGEPAPYVFAGVSIIEPSLFDGIADRAFSLNVIFDRAASKKSLFGVLLDGTWMHVGTPQALSEAESHLNERERRRA